MGELSKNMQRALAAMSPEAVAKLGFWFAQQGSILTFIALIFFYTWYMNRLDREYDVDEQ